MRNTKSSISIKGDVFVTLHDENTGQERYFESHNIALNYHLSALSKWLSGVNNTGYQAVSPPSVIIYGSGTGTPQPTDTGCFSPIKNSTTNLNLALPNNPQLGSTTLIFQTPANIITQTVTEAYLMDTLGNGWAHTMFQTPFTPLPGESITLTWIITYSN